MKSKYSKYRNVTRTRDLPATRGALHEFRAEMRSGHISLSLEHQYRQQFIPTLEHFKSVDTQFESLIHRMARQMEEQNFQNKFTLDKLIQHSDKQDRLEIRMSRLERDK